MTKLDFSAVTDARVGTQEVQRIYRGENRVWNRYCWEKWSCTGIAKESVTHQATGETAGVLESNSLKALKLYKSKMKSGTNYVLSDPCPTYTYTYGEAYSAGYKYTVGNGETTLGAGDTYLKITGYQYDGDVRQVKFTEYEIVEIRLISGYTQGSTSYGIVEGSAGDYPDNGRHSDGYWYVRVGAVGVKEE